MNTRTWIILAALLPLAAYARVPTRSSPSLSARVGWMQGNCLAIKAANLSLPQAITIMRLTGDGNVATHGTVTATPVSASACPGLALGRGEVNRADGYHFYTVTTTTPVDMAIAHLPGTDTTAWQFATCASSEGVQFTVSRHGHTLWRGYAYLGYDIRATCHDTDQH